MEIITLKKPKIITLTGGVNVIILAQIWVNFGLKFWQFWEPHGAPAFYHNIATI